MFYYLIYYIMETTTNCVPVKQTMWNLVDDIYEKSMRIKVRERDLAEKLFWLWENEWQLIDKEHVWIEQMLFTIRNILEIVIKRLDDDINNLD